LEHLCKDCGERDESKFARRSDNGKLYNFCRSCRQARYLETQRRYGAKPEVKAKKVVSDAEYAQRNREEIARYQKAYRDQRRDELLAQQKARYQRTKERHLEVSAKWKKDNPGVVNHTCMRRHAAKMQRVPKWLTAQDLAAIDALYQSCRDLTRATGIKHHVDHIYPLRGKAVSGLHVLSNLRIVTAAENCSKQNKVYDIV
jgi:hypothetical protein